MQERKDFLCICKQPPLREQVFGSFLEMYDHKELTHFLSFWNVPRDVTQTTVLLLVYVNSKASFYDRIYSQGKKRHSAARILLRR